MNPCNCDSCMKKTPREGFYHASRAEHTRDAETRAELDWWMEQQLGYDPKIGDRSLDSSTERPRSPAELAAALKAFRGQYPRVFRGWRP